MFTFTKSDTNSARTNCMFVASSSDHQVEGLQPQDFKTVTHLGDFNWDGKSLCATVYVMTGSQVAALARTAGVLLPVGKIYSLDDDLVMYGSGLVSPISAAEMGLALAQAGRVLDESEQADSSSDDQIMEDASDD